MTALLPPLHEQQPRGDESCPGPRGRRVEEPERATLVSDELLARGHELEEPARDGTLLLVRVHAGGELAFLGSAWRRWLEGGPPNDAVAPFPSVWPLRTERSAVVATRTFPRLGAGHAAVLGRGYIMRRQGKNVANVLDGFDGA